MPTIHLITGEKGGVGKTVVARTKIQYCLDRNFPFIAVETDRSNPDVARVYKDICKYAVFSEDEKQLDKADSIFEYAIDKPVIVSLPSQVHRAVSNWIDRNKLFEVGKQYKVDFCNWFVCNGRYDSVKLLINSLKHYQNNMPHILVQNWGVCDDWSQVEQDRDLQKLIKKYRVKVIDFPKLEYKETYLIDKNRLNFADARNHQDFTVLGKQRIFNFLNTAYTTFDSTGVWHESV